MRAWPGREVVTQPSAVHKERFRLLATAQLPRLYGLARRLVGDDAEDAVQDCLLKAYRGYGQLGDEAAAPAWLTSILVNCCRDRGRARARHPAEVDLDSVDEFSLYRKIADEDPFPYSDSLHLDFLHQFGADDVHAVLASLPGHYRIPLVLTYMDGWATKEVARMLDLRWARCWRSCTAAGNCSRSVCGTTPRRTGCSRSRSGD